ncbi:MAG: hypothetical protein JSS53_09850 [Proteobacteria bacterium]|nr:hypothetical protein [Pseudomonadota bacterium]
MTYDQRESAENIELNARQKVILDYIQKEKEVTMQQVLHHIASEIHEVPAKKTVVRDLNYLKSKGLVDSRGQKRGITWVFK